MDAKIPPGAPGSGAVDATTDLADGAGPAEATSGSVEGVADLPDDAVARVAEQLARGEIGRKEAVDRLLADTLDSAAIDGVPAEAREELAQVLGSLLESDPYLRSLVAGLGPRGPGEDG